MNVFIAVALGAGLAAAAVGAAQVQTRVLSRAEVQVVARDDGGGAEP